MPLPELMTLLTTTIAPTISTLAASAAAKASAINASGAVAWLEPDEFVQVLAKADESLVFHAERGRVRLRYEYLGDYRGLLFYTKSDVPLRLSGACHVVAVASIWKRNV